MKEIIGSIITDCADPNAIARQELAFGTLFNVAQPTFVGVDPTSSNPGLEVAGNLVDQLDVLDSFNLAENQQAVILANAAWRGSKTKKEYDNGVPFCYFWVGEQTLVASTFNGCLSLVHSQGIADEVEIVDLPRVLTHAAEQGWLSADQANGITHTQFRSLNFLPRLTRWILEGKQVPSDTKSLTTLDSSGQVVWGIDSFGNGKTSLLPETVDFEDGKEILLATGALAVCYTRLTDVPTGQTALIIGSSGYRKDRWLEWVIGGGNAKEEHGFDVGSKVIDA